jgi:hypothetical protein
LNTSIPPAELRRQRFKLILIAALFAAPIVVSFVLAQLGWRPVAAKNYGTLVEPPQDFASIKATGADGVPIAWSSPSGLFHVVVPIPDACGAPCAEFADSLQRIWQGLGKRAPRVRFLAAGTPDRALSDVLARFPQMQAVVLAPDPFAHPAARTDVPERQAPLPAYIVDPHGFLVLRYDAGFDPAGLKRDLEKLVR